jgi:hypothetical protein
MKKWIFVMCLTIVCMFAVPVTAQDTHAENRNEPAVKAGGVKSDEDRVIQLEAPVSQDATGNTWMDRIEVSGLIEIEAMHQRTDFSDPAQDSEDESDIDLATVELVVDARIADHVDGHVMFKYEEEDLFVDEGFITLSGTDAFPAFLIAGRQYLPFGLFESHFVTDPVTLDLGETNEDAFVAGLGLAEDRVVISAGLFNGDIDEEGKDDAIDSFVAAASFQPAGPLMMGVSYTSNLISSDTFSEFAVNDTIGDMVGGWSAYLTVNFLERFTFIAEYAAALDCFMAGDIYDAADTIPRKPAAWNLELGVSLLDNLELAFGYGGSDDGGEEFLPETRYGAVVNWGFFDNTNLALEYLRGEFENDGAETDTVTVQLAIEF